MGQEQSKQPFEMRIFLCGNYTQVVTKTLLGDKCEKTKIDKYSELYKKIDLKWEYILIDNEFRGNELDNYLFSNIKERVLNFRIKNNDKNLVIYFIDSFEEAKNVLSKFITQNERFHPVFIFMISNGKKEDIENSIISYLESVESNKLKRNYLNVLGFDGSDFLPLLQKLLKVCVYYNELGNDFLFSPVRHQKTFGEVVIGKPGAGKSTFINRILEDEKCRIGIGFPVTSKISKHYHEKYPVLIFDFPGFERYKDLEIILKKIEKLETSERIDVIFYLINKESARTFFQEELDILLLYLEKWHIPIYFVITKCRELNQGKDFAETTKIKLFQHFGNNTTLPNFIFPIELVEKKFGLRDLFTNIYNHFKPNLLSQSELDEIYPEDKDYEKNIIKTLNKSKPFSHYSSYEQLINKCYKNGVLLTSVANIIVMEIGGFSFLSKDDPTLDGLKISLIIGIAAGFGIEVDKGRAKQYLSTFEAGTSISSIGKSANSTFYKQARKKDLKSVVIEHIKNYESALNYFSSITD